MSQEQTLRMMVLLQHAERPIEAGVQKCNEEYKCYKHVKRSFHYQKQAYLIVL
jgi:hypothetical protein